MAERGAEDSLWDERYRSEFDGYATCAKKLQQLLEDLLADADIDVVAIESRAKDPDSLKRKVESKREKYKRPLRDVTDLIGVRAIVYYLEDVEAVSEIIANEFEADAENSVDKLDELGSDRFGYRSVHHVVSLSDERAKLAEWGLFNGKRAEIQVRTATQHAWAAVEHKLNYKRASEAPRDLRRRLTRLSALFELADEQFSAVRKQLGEVEAQYSDDVKGGNLNLPIDKASLEAFVAESRVPREVLEQAEAAGFEVSSPDEDGYQEAFDIDLGDLALALDQLGVKTVAEFDAILRDGPSITEAIEVVGGNTFGQESLWGSPADVLTVLMLYHGKAPDDLVASIYDSETVEALRLIREGRGG